MFIFYKEKFLRHTSILIAYKPVTWLSLQRLKGSGTRIVEFTKVAFPRPALERNAATGPCDGTTVLYIMVIGETTSSTVEDTILKVKIIVIQRTINVAKN